MSGGGVLRITPRRALLAALACLALGAAALARAGAVAEPDVVAPPVVAPDAQCPPEPVAPTADESARNAAAAVDNGLLWKATKGGRAV